MLMGANGSVCADTIFSTVTLTGSSSSDNILANVTLSGISTNDYDIVKATVEEEEKNFYKLGDEEAYVQIEFVNGSSHYKFMPGDVLTVTMLSTGTGKAGYRLKSTSRSNVEIDVEANQVYEVQRTLTADDIDADGKLTIYRANGIGHACRYYKFSVKCYRYGNDIFVSSNDISLGTAKLQVTSTEGSNVDLNTDVDVASVKSGSSVKFIATPADGKLFWYWKKNGISSWDNTNPITVNDISSSLDYQAVFTNGVHHYVHTNNSLLGTVKISGAGSESDQHVHVNPGTPNISFVATEFAGVFVGWYKDEAQTVPADNGDGCVYTDKTYKLTDSQLNNGLTLYAKFERSGPGLIVTFSANNPSMGTAKAYADGEELQNGDYVTSGKEVTFVATPIGSSVFWRWYDGTNYHYAAEKTLTVTGDMNMQAEFHAGVNISVYTNDSNLGEVTIEYEGKDRGKNYRTAPYPANNFTFKATEKGRGVFRGWYKTVEYTDKVSDSKTYVKDQTADDKITTSDYNLFAKFDSGVQVNAVVSPSNISPEITIHQSGHADWKITNHSYVLSGTTAVFSVADVAGYTFEGWYHNGTKIDAATQSEYNFGGVTADLTLTAKFTKESNSSVKADFADRGHGDASLAADGTFTSNAGWNNYANLFVFEAAGQEANRNVPTGKTGADYSGISITAKGDNFRILVYYKEGGAGDEKNKITNIDSSVDNKTYNYSWSDLGMTGDIANITRVCIAGPSGVSGTTTKLSSAYLIKGETESLDLTSVAGNAHGSHMTSWTVEDGKARMTVNGTSDNWIYIYDFEAGGNMEGHSASEFSGIRFHTTGDKFRVIAYSGTGDSKKTFVGYVSNSGESATAKTQHFKWSDLQIQWGSTPMTDADVANITKIAVAGNDTGSGIGDAVFHYIWLDRIKDYDNTFVCYGEEGGKHSYDANLIYTYSLNGASVAFKPIEGGDRNADDMIKVKPSATITVTSSSTFSHIKKINIIFADGSSTSITPSSDVSTYVYTNETGSNLFVSMVEVEYSESSISESHTITSGSDSRDYWLYVPVKVLTGSGTYPVVYSLHGTSNDYFPTDGGVQNFNDIAEREGFIVVYPRGRYLNFPVFGGTARGWEATGNSNKDTQFMCDILDDLKSNAQINTKINLNKVYMTGFSNGGMMAYATANVLPETFAAFASIAGIPVNEMHHRHHGDRPVPFLHIHGTKDDFVNYKHVPTIIDNMIQRNGLSLIPSSTVTDGNASVWGNATKYKMTRYGAAGSKTPIVYYEVGTGIGPDDSGLGHNKECVIAGTDSKQIIWDFLKGFSLNDTRDTNIEFKADITTIDEAHQNLAREHGWEVSSGSRILAQYGESGGYTTSNENVYHTIQLTKGKHYLKFTTANSEPSKNVIVRVIRLGDIGNFNLLSKVSFKTTVDDIKVNEAHKVGYVCVEINETSETGGEYQLTIMKENQNDKTTISNISIEKDGPVTTDTKVKDATETDFTGYFNYNNRLFAQWNFDLADGNRFDGLKLKEYADLGTGIWEANLDNTNIKYNPDGTVKQQASEGTITYTCTVTLGTSGSDTDLSTYDPLTYNGSDIIPIANGLKFKADAGHVKVQVDISGGQVTGTHLLVDNNVKMYIPYVTNSYRNDTDEENVPKDDKSNFGNYENCMHHIKRDIIYFAFKEGRAFDKWYKDLEGHDHKIAGVIYEKCINDEDKNLFRPGGEEYVNGKSYDKCDYMGVNGIPCVVRFKGNAIIDRIGVNRNMTYSFYSEYINELGISKPIPGMRIVGSPTGQLVANIGDTWTKYDNAITMTYGGWANDPTYQNYSGYTVSDDWDELGVFNGQALESKGGWNYGDDVFVTFANMATAPATNTTAAVDGFPVISRLHEPATSEGLMPSSTSTEEFLESGAPNYHPAFNGKLNDSYEENVTPWTLPCRGAFAKYEPTLPGVLNINMVQKGGCEYYIADEYGVPFTTGVYSKSAKDQTFTKSKGFTITNTDYVKHTLNVYPGKTYYVFSNDAGIAISGFYFEPYVYTNDSDDRIDVELKKITLNESENYTYPESLDQNLTRDVTSPGKSGDVTYTIHSDNRAVEVTLTRDKMNAGMWNSICLPYSINHSQLESVFGVGTRVILLRDIQDAGTHGYSNNTCNFICHENQDIIAGYPYFIMPTNTISTQVKTNAYIPKTTPSVVMIKSGEQFGGTDGYTFKGSFSKYDVPNGSYYLSKNDGTLKRLENPDGKAQMKAYRAWLEYTGPSKQENPAKYARKAITLFGTNNPIEPDFALDVNEINIDDVLEQQGIFTKATTVYSVNGQVVRTNALNLNNLPKGIYIVNGRKHIIK